MNKADLFEGKPNLEILNSVLHIRRGNKDNLRKLSTFLHRTIFCDPFIGTVLSRRF